jgi:oligopeptide transport system permease protein
MAITLFIIVSLSFIVMRLMPGNLYDDPHIPPTTRAAIEARYHLDRPILVQYGYFLRGLLIEGDWGVSIKLRPSIPVFQILWERIPISMMLNIFALIISLPLGIFFGTISALHRNKMIDNLVSFFVIMFISIPSFVFASLLQYWLAFRFAWFPIIYRASHFGMDYVMANVLPVVALSLGPIAVVARYLRGELTETLGSEFMLLAKTKGLTHTQAIVRHAFRNSLVPLVNLMVGMFVGILGGSLVIERIFAIPGVGSIMIDAINAMDHPLVMATLIFYSTVSLLAILIADVLYGIVDPRIRMGARR